jgi:hypothetical protein
MAGKGKKNGKIDEEIEESFPASDPPSFMGGEVLGAPKGRKSTGRTAKKLKKRKAVKAVTKARPKTAKKKKAATKKRKAR